MKNPPNIVFFYSFNCIDPCKAKKIFTEKDFKNESEAIRAAKNSKSILYKHRFVNGKKTLTEKIYDPIPL